MERNLYIVPAAILGICFLLSAFTASWFFYSVKSLGDVISVTGSAQKVITSDVAKWRVSLSRQSQTPDAKEAYAGLKSDLAALQSFLKKHEIDAKGVTVGTIGADAVYNNYNQGQGVAGYSVHQEVIVESGDVTKLTKTAQDAGTLLAQGALVTTTSLEYYYSKLADVKVDMLAAATKDAHARAEKIAESAGTSLGPLTEASMGVLQVTAVNSTDVSDYGSYDTSTVEKQITAVVRASFRVK